MFHDDKEMKYDERNKICVKSSNK